MLQHQREGGRWGAAGKAALFAAVGAGALFLAARPDGHAADKSDPPKASSPLDFVPAEAAAMVSIRFADLWDQPVFKLSLEAYRKAVPGAADDWRRCFGVGPDELERLTFVTLIAPQDVTNDWPYQEPCVVVTTRHPHEQKAILDVVAPGAHEAEFEERTYYTKDSRLGYAFLDDHSYVVGKIPSLARYLVLPRAVNDGPLAPALKLAAEKHLITVGVNVGAVLPTRRADPLRLKPLKPLAKAQLAVLTLDVDDQLRAKLKVAFANEADATEGRAALEDALDQARGGLVEAIADLNRGEECPKDTAFLREVQAVLRAAKSEQEGSTVEIAGAMKFDPETAAAMLTETMAKAQAVAKRAKISDQLKQLAIAAKACCDDKGGFPKPAIYDKKGKPLLSWRVMLLQHMQQPEAQRLYWQFHLDEPWDSEHNKTLLEKMPTVFAPPDSEAFKKHETYYQAFVGGNNVLVPEGLVTMSVITALNGASDTILFVEAAKSVPWTKPEDVPFDEGKLVPKLGGLNKDGFQVVFCDGHVQYLPLTINEKILRYAATYNNQIEFILPDK